MDKFVMAKYIRLSREDSLYDSHSIENQQLMLDKFIADMDISDIEVVEFVDNGFSGTNFERPAMQQLLDLVREGKVNCIIVKDFSRFGRNSIEMGCFLEKIFPLYNVRFISVGDFYDSKDYEGSSGGLEVVMKFLVHEHYSQDLSKKIKAARLEKACRGELISKNCVYGYVKTKENKLGVDSVAADTVSLIFSIACAGKSYNKIRQELYNQKRQKPSVYKRAKQKIRQGEDSDFIWSDSVIRQILKDERYTGTYVAGKVESVKIGSHTLIKKPESEWIRIPDHHPAIISKEVFGRVQELFSKDERRPNKRSKNTSEKSEDLSTSIFSGKIVCGCCGHKMQLIQSRNATFICNFTRSIPDAKCNGVRLSCCEVEEVLSQMIFRQAQAVLGVNSLKEVDGLTINALRQSECQREIEQVNLEKRALYESLMSGALITTEYYERKKKLDSTVDCITSTFNTLKNEQAKVDGDERRNAKIKTALSHNGKLTKELVDLLVKHIEVYPDKQFHINWKVAEFFEANIKLPT